MERLTIPQSLAEWNERGEDYLPGHLGMECLAVEPDEVRMRMRVEPRKCAWNGFLHAGAVVSLADTACGYGHRAQSPGRRQRLHDPRAQEQLPRHHAGGRRDLRGATRPQGPDDPGLGRRGPRGANRQDNRPLSLHPDDPALAELAASAASVLRPSRGHSAPSPVPAVEGSIADILVATLFGTALTFFASFAVHGFYGRRLIEWPLRLVRPSRVHARRRVRPADRQGRRDARPAHAGDRAEEAVALLPPAVTASPTARYR